MRTTYERLIILVILAVMASVASCQTDAAKETYSHGTCATAVMAPFGAAFIIDSRLTLTDANGAIISKVEGCKVRLARPTILLAGVGLENLTRNSGRWNSLDQAEKMLKLLPENPTEEQLNQWGEEWGRSLRDHFTDGREIPLSPGPVAEVLLVTKIGNEPYYRRTTVYWTGDLFRYVIAGQDTDKTHPYVRYSGACRNFVVHSDEVHHVQVPGVARNIREESAMRQIEDRMRGATTVAELMTAAAGLEDVLTKIDTRLQGKRAVTAPPYATAEWDEGAAG